MFSDLEMSTSTNSVSKSILHLPNVSGSISMTVPGSKLVPVMVVINLDFSELKMSVSRPQILLITRIIENILFLQSVKSESTSGPTSPCDQNKLNTTFHDYQSMSQITNRTIETLDFSDDVTEEEFQKDDVEKEIEKRWVTFYGFLFGVNLLKNNSTSATLSVKNMEVPQSYCRTFSSNILKNVRGRISKIILVRYSRLVFEILSFYFHLNRRESRKQVENNAQVLSSIYRLSKIVQF
jgi:hypothetical protein